MSEIVNVIFSYADGRQKSANLPIGRSLAEGARENGVDGIRSDCGYTLACATCHVYVSKEWINRMPAMSDDEDGMLDGTVSPRRTESRLSCQIIMTPDLDGLAVELPKRQ